MNFKQLEKDYYKSSNRYRKQILSVCTNSDIATMLLDKYSEIDLINLDRKAIIKWSRWDSRKICNLLYNDEVKVVEKIILWFKYELKMRDPNQDTDDIAEKLENAKLNINIVNLIESLVGIELNSGRGLNKCPLPNHKDNTASFKVYYDTNSWYCFWCKAWWDIVSFVQHLYWTTIKEAIKKTISLNKK